MATRNGPVQRADRRARDDLRRIGGEIHDGRIGAGLGLRDVAAAAGTSPSQLLRIERGEAPHASIGQLARIAAVVGLDVRLRAYPGPDAIRDAGQTRLLERLRVRLPATVGFGTEVLLPSMDDQRAWDAWLSGLVGIRRTLPVEGETRLSDIQAFLRRLHRKMRDADEPFALVVAADTRANRDAIAASRALLDPVFPVRPRTALSTLSSGQHPGGSALVLL